MTLTEEVFAQAVLLAGELSEAQTELLKLLCAAAVSSLSARLKEGLTPENCKENFLAAASLNALAGLNCAETESGIQEFRAGDLTVKQGNTRQDMAARDLRQQAETLMGPYLKDRFSFVGV